VRAHYVEARLKVREYPGGSMAVLDGPRCLCRYDQEGRQITAPDPTQPGLMLDAVRARPGGSGACRAHSAMVVIGDS
jgi:hypothetical protein